MKKFTKLESLGLPLGIDNIDTDLIIPAVFLTSVSRSGYGENLFKNLKEQPNCPLNDARYQGARILIAGTNFGCGSSREHAVWALTDYGFQVVIAKSFADIFYNNALKNGLLPIALAESDINYLINQAKNLSTITVDLEAQVVISDRHFPFPIDQFRKDCLLNGLDDFDYLLKAIPKIKDHFSSVNNFRNLN